ncbi:MAG: TIGR03118 family protein [Solirubrobacterales bacterium]|nr:TIGR03118 family protein [Solirubrobacterales bacterium]
MRQRVPCFGRAPRRLLAALSLLATIGLIPSAARADSAPASATASGTVLQTNLVSDLPGVAAMTDGNLVNAWGISESPTSPFWISDNGAGVSTLYQVPGAGSTPVSISPLVVSIPTPVSLTGGTPTGTVFNLGGAAGAFPITGPNKADQTTTSPAVFLFATEDGTIVGWNPGIDPSGKFDGPGGVSTHAVIAVNHSGNNFTNPDPTQQTGAVYKGVAVETSSAPIIPADADSTALLYASNFRAGTVEVYDAKFNPVTVLPAGAFRDPRLPAHYAPFNVQVLSGKVYVTYARQNATGHDDVAGPHRGFVDVFNPDGSPGLPNGKLRLISRGPLDSPWGLAIAPTGFAKLSAPRNDPVLLVGNFGNGFINAFDATTGTPLGQLKDPDGEPIQIDGLWALKVGNNAAGGAADTVYFTAGPFGESHGLFGSLSTAAPGSPEGPAEAQWVRANLDVVQLDLQHLIDDSSSGASADTIRQDVQTLDADSQQLFGVERAFAHDTRADAAR